MLEAVSIFFVLVSLLISYYNIYSFGKKLVIQKDWMDNDLLIFGDMMSAITEKDDRRLEKLIKKKKAADAAYFDAILKTFTIKLWGKRLDV